MVAAPTVVPLEEAAAEVPAEVPIVVPLVPPVEAAEVELMLPAVVVVMEPLPPRFETSTQWSVAELSGTHSYPVAQSELVVHW